MYASAHRMNERGLDMHEDLPFHLRRLAEMVESTCGPAGAGDPNDVVAKIADVSRLVERTAPRVAPELQAALVELERALSEWRAADSTRGARALAQDRARAIAQRLRLMSELLEATS